MDSEKKKPFMIMDVTRTIKIPIVTGSLEEMRSLVAEKFDKIDQLPQIHLDSDGTEIDEESFYHTLEANTDLIAVFPGEKWIDEKEEKEDRFLIYMPKDKGDKSDAPSGSK